MLIKDGMWFVIALVFMLGAIFGCGDDDDDSSESPGLDDDDDVTDDDATDDDDVTDDDDDDDVVGDDDDDDFSDDDDDDFSDDDDDDFSDDDDDDVADDDDDDTVASEITVLTINLQNPTFNPFFLDERTQIVADLINDQQPDFVALQEVTQTWLIQNRAQALAGLTGYNWEWHETHEIPLLFEEGIGILTPWPINSVDVAVLPHSDLFGLVDRAVLMVNATTPAGDINFFGSHWTIDSSPTVKADQAVAALDFIESFVSPLPMFFAGDLNAEPDSLAMEVLRGDDSWQGQWGEMIDAWIQTNGTAPGYTFPSDSPDRRIDYVYFLEGTSAATQADSCALAFDLPVGGIMASDHIGVICDFSFVPVD